MIIGAAAGGGLLLIVGLIILIVCLRRHFTRKASLATASRIPPNKEDVELYSVSPKGTGVAALVPPPIVQPVQASVPVNDRAEEVFAKEDRMRRARLHDENFENMTFDEFGEFLGKQSASDPLLSAVRDGNIDEALPLLKTPQDFRDASALAIHLDSPDMLEKIIKQKL